MPDYLSFHKSITEELYSLKDRIRNLVHHWPTDGEWKEVALRNLLRKHLPASVTIGRGFIVTADNSSTQIDILVIDARKPTLFKDGDLLIVTPDSVLAAVEVKTRQNAEGEFEKTLTKLSEIEKLCKDTTGQDSVWTGLFTFNENEISAEKVLRAVCEARRTSGCTINCVAVGRSSFVRYWLEGEAVGSPANGEVWHAYRLDSTAPSYFLGNLVDWISAVDHGNAQFAWFPELGGKEQHGTHFIRPGDAEVRPLP